MRKKLKADTKKNKVIKKDHKQSTTKHHFPTITWICTICNQARTIYINERNRHLYNEAREKKYKCISCK